MQNPSTIGNMSGASANRKGDFYLYGRKVFWREKSGGEIVFGFVDGETKYVFDRFVSLLENESKDSPHRFVSKETDDIKLNLVNNILAYYRQIAPGDGKPGDKDSFKTAAAGVITDEFDRGTLYIGMNNDHANADDFERGCAEREVLKAAQTATGNHNVQFRELYLMAGKMEQRDGRWEDVEPGHMSCLCGECRKLMREHTENTRFFMIPTNDFVTSKEDGRAEISAARISDPTKLEKEFVPVNGEKRLKKAQAWELGHDLMYPLPTHELIDDPDLVSLVLDGYDYLTNPNRATLLPHHWAEEAVKVGAVITDELKARLLQSLALPTMKNETLEHDHSLVNINKTMLGYLKDAYAKHFERLQQEDKLREPLDITVMIVKTKRGEFFPSVVVNSQLLPSKPGGSTVALTNAYNERNIAEVYMMNFNQEQMEREQQQQREGMEVIHAMPMPDPMALGRIVKNMGANKTKIHSLALNDGTLNEQQLGSLMWTGNVKEISGPHFTSPKSGRADGRW